MKYITQRRLQFIVNVNVYIGLLETVEDFNSLFDCLEMLSREELLFGYHNLIQLSMQSIIMISE